LGLSLVDRLTRLHNGRIEVFSEVGKGSKFIVTIPWKKAQTDHLMDSSKRNLPYFDNFSVIADNQTNLGTVLLIDDNKINNDMVSDFLKFHGYKVITALDGKQGLEQVAQSHPAIILTDIQIPGMDGLEVIKSIRKMPGEVAKIPIIALTALAMPDDRQRCLEAGADDYLSKPMDWNSLLDAIRNHIGKNK
jgi:CheY-like chemotaxis protein